MQTDVAELQNALLGSATWFADLMVQLFTSEPRVRRVIEAGDEATAVVSRLQALETRSTGAMTSVAQRFSGKEATDYQPQTWSGEKGSESFAAFKMKLQNWVGSLHDNMMRVMDVGDAKEGRLKEVDIKNCRNVTRKVDDVKEMDTRRTRCTFHAPKEERRATYATLKDPRTGADRSVAYARVTRVVSQHRLTSSRLKTLKSARNIMQTWEHEVAEFEMKLGKKVEEDAKILTLKSIMPETMFGEVCVSFNFHADLRTAIINYLDHKVPVSMMKQGSTNINNEHGSDLEPRRSRTTNGRRRDEE